MKKCIESAIVLMMFITALPAYSQPVDTVVSYVRSWLIDPLSMEKKPVAIDTALYPFHILHNAYRENISNTFLGNLGAPVLSNNFYSREKYDGFPFLSYYLPYLHLPLRVPYFNTRRPFTVLTYSMAGTKVNLEQTLHFVHTQNVNKDFNVGLLFDLFSSEGQYTYQKTKDNAFTFFSSYEKERYSMYMNLDFNKMDVQENGGVVDDNDLEDLSPKDIAVNLVESFNASYSRLNNQSLYLAHKYRFIRKNRDQGPDSTHLAATGGQRQLIEPSFSHTLLYERNYRLYSDRSPASGFYDTVLINNAFTRDSARYRNLRNNFRFEFLTDTTRKFSFLGRAGIVSEMVKYGHVIPADTVVHLKPPTIVDIPGGVVVIQNNDTTFNRFRDESYHNLGVNFFMQSSLTKYVKWDFLGEFFLSGYKQGDFSMKGGFDFNLPGKKIPIVLKADLEILKKRPGYFLNHYSSNHFAWRHDFADEASTVISGRLAFPVQKFEAGLTYGLFDNYMYFDTTAQPRQETTPLSVIALDISKHITAGKYRSVSKVEVQWTGNEGVLPLPFFSAFHSSYLEHRLYFRFTEGKIFYQLGFDFRYNTSFFGYAYMPATGIFYNQNEKKLGNYPYLDLFFNLKLKRTRFFLKLEHPLSGVIDANYFGALHYPMNGRAFKFGLSWTFYN